MTYIVNEYQLNNGVPAVLSYAFADPTKTDKQREMEAKAKYYSILAVACLSNLEFHGVYYMSEDGEQYKFEYFDRRVKE